MKTVRSEHAVLSYEAEDEAVLIRTAHGDFEVDIREAFRCCDYLEAPDPAPGVFRVRGRDRGLRAVFLDRTYPGVPFAHGVLTGGTVLTVVASGEKHGSPLDAAALRRVIAQAGR